MHELDGHRDAGCSGSRPRKSAASSAALARARFEGGEKRVAHGPMDVERNVLRPKQVVQRLIDSTLIPNEKRREGADGPHQAATCCISQ
jgi:hypothetical protein